MDAMIRVSAMRARRLKQGTTLAKLAEASALNVTRLHIIETEKAKPTRREAALIADALGTVPSTLWTKDEIVGQ